MNLFTETIAWFADPAHWTGPSGIPTRTAQHIAITILVTLMTVVVAVPLGAWMGHSHRGQATIAAAANATRALPTLGLVTLLALWLGIGLGAPMIALVILAIPSVLAATYAGVANVPRPTVDAARAMGHTSVQTLTKIELPLALPVIGGGIQSAMLQVIATATVAAYVADVGLGRYIFAGLKSRDYPEMLAGSILVIILALVVTAVATGAGRLHHRLARNQGAQQ